MPWNRYILGYHGCEMATAKRIVAGEDDLRPSRNDYDWLGHGCYFWEDSPDRAWLWARARAKGESGFEPAVVGAVIDLGHCLNLVETQNLDLVAAAYELLQALHADAEIPLPRNTGKDLLSRNLDCAIIQTLHRSREREGHAPFDTVRAYFSEGEALYPTSGLRRLDHVQVCVRNTAAIVGYFLPRYAPAGG